MAYVKPESALAQAAEALLARHAGRADGTCVSCGRASPCETARHAAEVRAAAGLAALTSGSFAQVSGANRPMGASPVGLSKQANTGVPMGAAAGVG